MASHFDKWVGEERMRKKGGRKGWTAAGGNEE